MSNTNVGRRPGQSLADFHLLSKHRWNEEVVRIVKASKSSQQRMAVPRPIITSAVGPEADIGRSGPNVRFGPQPDLRDQVRFDGWPHTSLCPSVVVTTISRIP